MKKIKAQKIRSVGIGNLVGIGITEAIRKHKKNPLIGGESRAKSKPGKDSVAFNTVDANRVGASNIHTAKKTGTYRYSGTLSIKWK